MKASLMVEWRDLLLVGYSADWLDKMTVGIKVEPSDLLMVDNLVEMMVDN